jgi:ABC-type bacteriocin/lantibiotic exporter with double-glycine peptidase domain
MKNIRCYFGIALIASMMGGCSAQLDGIKIPDHYLQSLPAEAMLDVPLINQGDNYSCATTSLAMVMAYYDPKGYQDFKYGKQAVFDASGSSVFDITKRCGNDMEGLKRAAKHFGFHKNEFATGLSMDHVKYLVSKNIPVIINIKNFNGKSYHAVVVVGYNQKGLYLNDPGPGKKYFKDRHAVETNWHAHLCTPMSAEYHNSAFIVYPNP